MSTSSETKPRGAGGMSGMRWGKLNPPHDPTASFKGATVVVVGATAGVGLEAAIKFVKLEASHLIIGARNIAGVSILRDRLDVDIPGWSTKCKLDVHPIDLASPSSIESFVKQIQVDSIDVALVNGGLAAASYQVTEAGWETSIQVEVLGKALCSILLLPKLSHAPSSSSSHLVITGSEAYLDLTDNDVRSYDRPGGLLKYYNQEENFGMVKQYLVCKGLLMFFVQGLAKHLHKSQTSTSTTTAPSSTSPSTSRPVVLAASPGMTKTSLGRDFPWLMQLFQNQTIYRFAARTAEEGGRALVSAATVGPEANGRFWFNDMLDPHEPTISPEVWDKVQEAEVENILRVLQEGCPDVKTILADL